MNYKRRITILIAISAAARVIIASTAELSNDEVYYWTYAQHLQWNYFDHPPLVGWLIRLTTANLLLHNEFFVRLGAIISSAVCTWLMFKIGTFINNTQTGWFSALLYTSSIYAGIIAGTFILPDSPQMFFWLAGILLLLKISYLPAYNSKSNLLWCLFGIVAGLCIMSKVHGIFLWLGAGLYVLFIHPKWLKHPGIYISAVITLVIISPVIIWNIQNHFASYTFHGSRVSINGAEIHADGFARELAGEIFYNNPVNFFLICINIFAAIKGKLPVDKKDVFILLFCSLPLILVLLFVSLFRETLPHWSGPAYCALLILPAIKLASVSNENVLKIPGVIKGALAFIIILAAAGICIINFYPGTLSPQKQGLQTGSGDFTLDMYGWEDAGKKFDSLYKSDVANKIMPVGAPIIINKWFPAAHIDFYIATITKQQTVGIGNIFDLHQYYWSNKYKKKLNNGDAAYFIVPSNMYNNEALIEISNNFKYHQTPVVLSQLRSGILCKQLYVFRLKGYCGK